jgi:hypothetical protein
MVASVFRGFCVSTVPTWGDTPQYIEGESLKTKFFSCKNLPGKTTGEEIFHVTVVYIRENNLRWEDCVSICRDDVASMTGKWKASKLKSVR